MPLRPASLCTLLLLAGCAMHPETPVEKAKITLPAAPLPKPHGTILAMRPVPAEARDPARVVLAGLGTKGTIVEGQIFEFIVRTEYGTTISIVQPQSGGLHPGERVSIVQGAETRIDAPLPD